MQNSTAEPQLTDEDLSDVDKCLPLGLRKHYRRAMRSSLRAKGMEDTKKARPPKHSWAGAYVNSETEAACAVCTGWSPRAGSS